MQRAKILLCLILMQYSFSAAAETAMNAVPSGLVQLVANSAFYSRYAFVVDKSQRMLSVWQGTNQGPQKVRDFPADVGRNMGEKQARDDRRTPVGTYFLTEMLEGAGLDFKLYGKRAFTLNYPNFFDQLDGKTGSGIWLHAVPDDVPLTRGSRGCVVVRNDSILELSDYISLGKTPILIYEKLDLISDKTLGETRKKLLQAVENWRSAWSQKRIDDYIQFYSEDFRSQRMNRNAWKAFKSDLAKQYSHIDVKLSEPIAFRSNDRWIVRFIQQYTSDQHTDLGEKTLFLREENGQLKIVSENWAENQTEQARQEISQSTWATL